jgi:hypothetical protein
MFFTRSQKPGEAASTSCFAADAVMNISDWVVFGLMTISRGRTLLIDARIDARVPAAGRSPRCG